jgi:hypothetical protein
MFRAVTQSATPMLGSNRCRQKKWIDPPNALACRDRAELEALRRARTMALTALGTEE